VVGRFQSLPQPVIAHVGIGLGAAVLANRTNYGRRTLDWIWGGRWDPVGAGRILDVVRRSPVFDTVEEDTIDDLTLDLIGCVTAAVATVVGF
jgi:hypothetical protein